MNCRKGYELKPYKSAAGWYVGTRDEDGCPYCRISEQYYKTQDDCQRAMNAKTYIVRQSFETDACCGGLLPDSPQVK